MIKLISLTTPVVEGINTPDELLAYCARVSNPDNQLNGDSKKLIQYLIKHKHWSPFEMVTVCMGIETSRDIARQILRHRSFSFQEYSQRYALSSLGNNRDARLQDTTNRQNSLYTEDSKLKKWWDEKQTEIKKNTSNIYKEAINKGIAKEVARAILPEGLTISKLYMTGSLRSWIHYCQLRADESTQLEHRKIAQYAKEILLSNFPSIELAFRE